MGAGMGGGMGRGGGMGMGMGGGGMGGGGFADGAVYQGSNVGGVAAGGMAGGMGGDSRGVMVTRGGGGADAGCCAGACDAGGGCGVAGCGADCSVVSGPAVMSFVGTGGDYIVETNYKYVGNGAGIYSVVAPRKSYLGVVACVSTLLLLALLLFLLWPRTVTTTTGFPFRGTTTPPPLVGTCVFWGDPHIITFDGARPSFYGNGEFWVVKSDEVHIQGRYLGTSWTHGLAATNKLIVGGPFLNGHKIAIGTVDSGEMTVDGQPVLGALGSRYSVAGIATLSYSGVGQLVDKAQTEFPKRIVQMDLPLGVKISVMRWPNYVDFKIEMPEQPNQDGTCGNFNGDASDDTPAAIIERIGARVRRPDLLFSTQSSERLSPEMERMMANDCVAATRAKARPLCQNSPSPGACEFDVCFGMNPHARKEALRFATNSA